jgi:CheY-like chemotaxis protein
MSDVINLLIIEDEPAQIQVYEDVIAQFNKKNDPTFNYTICNSYAEGETALKSPNFDAAIIDLKLSNTEELEGVKLVKAVYQKIRIPIIIYSGSIAQIDDIKENVLLKKKLRTEQLSNILIEITSIFKTGITTFLRPDGIIDSMLTNIFWNHLANDLSAWITHNNPKSLLRYILTNFQEDLDINLDGDFEDYHPFEVYIKPPIKKNIHTGDLINYNESLYLILTPACDIVIQGYRDIGDGKKEPVRKADNVILVKTREFDYKNLCLDKKHVLDKSKIKNYVTNSSYRYHYLPPFDGNSGFLIDFQDIISVSFSSDFNRVASISSPFIKDIISRFSNYYSRQGQPTFNQDQLVDELYKR